MFSLSDFLTLPPKTRRSIISMLSHAHRQKKASPKDSPNALLECPQCGSMKYRRNGWSPSGISRYQCRVCLKTFSERRLTPLHGIKQDQKFTQFLSCMLSGYKTLQEMATEAGISVSTAFKWKHRILQSLSETVRTEELIRLIEKGSKRRKTGMKGAKVVEPRHDTGSLLLSMQYFYSTAESDHHIGLMSQAEPIKLPEESETGHVISHQAPLPALPKHAFEQSGHLLQAHLKGVSSAKKGQYDREVKTRGSKKKR